MYGRWPIAMIATLQLTSGMLLYGLNHPCKAASSAQSLLRDERVTVGRQAQAMRTGALTLPQRRQRAAAALGEHAVCIRASLRWDVGKTAWGGEQGRVIGSIAGICFCLRSSRVFFVLL